MEDPEMVNDLMEGATKAVRLPDGRIVTEALANKSRLDRNEGGRVICEGCIYVEPIIEEDEK